MKDADGARPGPVTREPAWTEQIRGLFDSLLKVLRGHPAAAGLLLQFKKTNEAANNVTELTLDILRTAGLSPEDVSLAARSALWTCISLVMGEPGCRVIRRRRARRIAAEEAS